MSRKRYVQQVLPYGLMAALAGLFYATVLRYAVAIPRADDYALYFTLVRVIDRATPLAESLRLLVEQHNDHRILLTRLVALADYAVEGHLNLRTLILLGSLCSAGLWGAFALLFRPLRWSGWALGPVALWLFQPSYQENVWWALSVWQHTATLLGYFALFALVLRPGAGAQLSAGALGLLLLYSNSNGPVAWVAVLALLAVQRRWWLGLIWALAGGLFIWAYYGLDYDFRSQSSLLAGLAHPGWLFNSMAGFLGGAVWLPGRGSWAGWLVMITGLGVAGVFAVGGARVLWPKKRPLSNAELLLLAVALVLLGTGGAAALTRSSAQFQVTDRYQIYSVTSLLVAYGLLLCWAENRWRLALVAGATLVSGLFCVLHYRAYVPLLRDTETRLVADDWNVQTHGFSPVETPFLRDTYWQNLFRQARERGVYRAPETVLTTFRPERSGRGKNVASVMFATDSAFDPITQQTHVQLRAMVQPPPAFVLLAGRATPGQSATFVLPALTAGGQETRSLFIREALPPGCYRLEMLRHVAGGWRAQPTTQQICR